MSAFGDDPAVARLTGLEPATPGVTGRYSNRLSYNRVSTRRDRVPNVGCDIRIPRPPVKRPRRADRIAARPPSPALAKLLQQLEFNIRSIRTQGGRRWIFP